MNSTLIIVASSIMMERVWAVALVLLFLTTTSTAFALGSLFIPPAQVCVLLHCATHVNVTSQWVCEYFGFLPA